MTVMVFLTFILTFSKMLFCSQAPQAFSHEAALAAHAAAEQQVFTQNLPLKKQQSVPHRALICPIFSLEA